MYAKIFKNLRTKFILAMYVYYGYIIFNGNVKINKFFVKKSVKYIQFNNQHSLILPSNILV